MSMAVMVVFFSAFISISLLQTAVASVCMESHCRFELVIRQRRSMTYTSQNGVTFNVAWNVTASRLQIVENAFHKEIDQPSIGDFVDDDDVITTDGRTRNIYVVNDQFPGPTLEVMEGAKVSVTVVNKLGTEAVSIHFHGIHFDDNVWMDGVGHVTQCPILPGQSFTYKFIADPAGTHWYHGHFRNSRIDGIFGAFIVHTMAPPQMPYHVMSVQDWYDEDATTLRVMDPYSPDLRGTGEAALFVFDRDYSVDGNELSAYAYDVTLIGGRGRRDDSDDLLPLATYDVTIGVRHRFRVIHTGAEFQYEVMVDSHVIAVVALDGQDIQPITVDSFMISPGERVDFIIKPTQSVARYWIRAELIRQGTGLPIREDDVIKGGKAILNYEGTLEDGDPTSARRECTADDPCTVFNCPYLGYRIDQYKTCLTLNDASSAHSSDYLDDVYGIDDDEFEEYFLNFGFHIGSSVNSRKFSHPTAPFSGPNDDNIIHCDDEQCENGCFCTFILNVQLDKTIQLVLSNLQFNSAFLGHHAIHLHGHNFAVMKMGFPDFNESTGLWESATDDMACNSDLCTQPRWKLDMPVLNDERPPVKDTIMIPARGYAVIRFRSENPGYWMLHCHQESHLGEGMAMLINEGPGYHPPVPENFPTCGDFHPVEKKPTSGKGDRFLGCPFAHSAVKIGSDDENDDHDHDDNDDDDDDVNDDGGDFSYSIRRNNADADVEDALCHTGSDVQLNKKASVRITAEEPGSPFVLSQFSFEVKSVAEIAVRLRRTSADDLMIPINVPANKRESWYGVDLSDQLPVNDVQQITIKQSEPSARYGLRGICGLACRALECPEGYSYLKLDYETFNNFAIDVKVLQNMGDVTNGEKRMALEGSGSQLTLVKKAIYRIKTKTEVWANMKLLDLCFELSGSSRAILVVETGEKMYYEFKLTGLAKAQWRRICIGDDPDYDGPLSLQNVKSVEIEGAGYKAWRLRGVQLASCVLAL